MTTIPDWLAALGLVVPALTGLAGYFLAGRNERLRDERIADREADARRASVRERLEEQTHATQRQTLLELQDALQRAARSAARIVFHDQGTLRQHGTLTQVGRELDEESYEIGVTMRRLQERVLDSELRAAVGQFHSRLVATEARLAIVKNMEPEDGIRELDAQLDALVEHYETVSETVGAALRTELGWLPQDRPDAA